MGSMFDEVFGEMPARPDTPDFRRLVDVVLKYTGRFEDLRGEERDLVYEQLMGEQVDVPSVSYMALQRALRPLGIRTQADLVEHWDTVKVYTTLWLEGFMVGCQFKDAGGKQ